MQTGDTTILEADFELGFTYTRSPGVIMGKFLAALQHRELYGIRGSDGKVLFPPTEYDPRTADTLHDFVPVADTGRLVAWTWIAQPRAHHGVTGPFAFALVQLDGADTPFLHRLFCGSETQLKTGLRVKVQWSEERRGCITDIHGFAPAED